MNFRYATGPVVVAFDGVGSAGLPRSSPVVPIVTSNEGIITYDKPAVPTQVFTITVIRMTDSKFWELWDFIHQTIEGQKQAIRWTPLSDTYDATPNPGGDLTGHFDCRVWSWGRPTRNGLYYNLPMTLRVES